MSRAEEIVNIANLVKSTLDNEVFLKGVEADRAVLISQTTINLRNKVESSLEKLIHLLEEKDEG